MPEPAILPALDRAIKGVLERMFFIEAISDPDPDTLESGPEMQARLTFEGSPRGWFALRVTNTAAQLISADFLGIEESEMPGQQVEAVICELANMICGSVLSSIESTCTFRLGPPRIVQSVDGADRAAEITLHSVRIASGVLTAVLAREGPACSAAAKSEF